ncbi:uncharacterized protein LOC130293695 [Hyla sarda]|uniref:uncharacterized protein LOC130293695 n=1 Tax=Hyla sarda TaxID=327740 RepID=UPI0024C24030|nr:uncharacterized protein LOC130293695 [Hyla sarda]
MEKKTPEQLDMTLPPYKLFSKPPDSRTKWTAAILLGLVLSGIAVIITLTIYMNQKKAEKMVEMTYSSGDGENVQQMVYVHDGQDIAAIFIKDKANKYSASVLLDYNQKLIGIRTLNRCYLLRMEDSKIPSKQDLLRRIEYYQAHNSTLGDTVTFSFILSKEANPMDLGININLLCSNVATYWTTVVNMEQNQRKLQKDGEVIIIIIQ